MDFIKFFIVKKAIDTPGLCIRSFIVQNCNSRQEAKEKAQKMLIKEGYLEAQIIPVDFFPNIETGKRIPFLIDVSGMTEEERNEFSVYTGTLIAKNMDLTGHMKQEEFMSIMEKFL